MNAHIAMPPGKNIGAWLLWLLIPVFKTSAQLRAPIMNPGIIAALDIRSISIRNNTWQHTSYFNTNGKITRFRFTDKTSRQNKFLSVKYYPNGQPFSRSTYQNHGAGNSMVLYDLKGNECSLLTWNGNKELDYYSSSKYAYDKQGRTTLQVTYQNNYRADSVICAYDDRRRISTESHYDDQGRRTRSNTIAKDDSGRILSEVFAYGNIDTEVYRTYTYGAYGQTIASFEEERPSADAAAIAWGTETLCADSLPLQQINWYCEKSPSGDTLHFRKHTAIIYEYDSMNRISCRKYYDTSLTRMEQFSYNRQGQPLVQQAFHAVEDTAPSSGAMETMLRHQRQSRKKVWQYDTLGRLQQIQTFGASGCLQESAVFDSTGCCIQVKKYGQSCLLSEETTYAVRKTRPIADSLNWLLDTEHEAYSRPQPNTSVVISYYTIGGVPCRQRCTYTPGGLRQTSAIYKDGKRVEWSRRHFYYDKKGVLKKIVCIRNGHTDITHIQVAYR